MTKQMAGLIDKVMAALKVASDTARHDGVPQEAVTAIAQHVQQACDRHRAAGTEVKSISASWK